MVLTFQPFAKTPDFLDTSLNFTIAGFGTALIAFFNLSEALSKSLLGLKLNCLIYQALDQSVSCGGLFYKTLAKLVKNSSPVIFSTWSNGCTYMFILGSTAGFSGLDSLPS